MPVTSPGVFVIGPNNPDLSGNHRPGCGRPSPPTRLRRLISAATLVCAAGIARGQSAAPPVAIGSGFAPVGGGITLPIRVTDALTNVAGLDLEVVAAGPAGAPDPALSYANGVDDTAWLSFSSPSKPRRYVIYTTIGIPGPAELMELTLALDPSTAPGTAYTISADSAILADDAGVEQAGAALVAPGSVMAALPGDLNGDGQVDARDVDLLLMNLVGLRTPTARELGAGDVRPRPGAHGLPFGDGRLGADDLNWVFRRFIGLETAP